MQLLKLYLDTSILSSYFDFYKPVRQLITQKWFSEEAGSFKLYISDLVITEVEANPNEQIRNGLFELIKKQKFTLLEITDDVIALASEYRQLILKKEINDIIHLAAASLYSLDTIASWNFKHIVNISTMKAIHKCNLKHGLPLIEIVSLENLGGFRYGNI